MIQDYIEAVKQATEENNHSNAVSIMAQYVVKTRGASHSQLLQASQAVETLHDFYGHLTEQLKDIRDDVTDRIESFLTADEKAAFDGAR